MTRTMVLYPCTSNRQYKSPLTAILIAAMGSFKIIEFPQKQKDPRLLEGLRTVEVQNIEPFCGGFGLFRTISLTHRIFLKVLLDLQ